MEAPREGADGAPVVVLGAGVVVVVVDVVVVVVVSGVTGLVGVVSFLVVGSVVEGGGLVKSTSQLDAIIFNIYIWKKQLKMSNFKSMQSRI